MSTSLQISPEAFRDAAATARDQQLAQEAAAAGNVRIHVGNYHTAMSANGMQAQTIDNMQSFGADDLAREGIVGSLGAHRQHSEAIVKLPGGMDTTLENAYRMGMIGKDSSGQYYDFDGPKKNDVSGNHPETPQATPKETAPEPEFKVPEAALGSLAVLSESLPEHHVDQLLETAALHSMVNEQVFDGAGNPLQLDLSAFAGMAGIDEGTLHSHVGSVLNGYQVAADKALRSLGVDTDNFYQFLKDEHPAKLKATMKEHYLTKDASIWKSLVPLYRTSVLPTEEALQRAGIPVGHRNGEAYVTLNGIEMTIKAAAVAGLL